MDKIDTQGMSGGQVKKMGLVDKDGRPLDGKD